LALADDGNLFVTDALNFRIQVFSPEGKFLRKFGEVGDGSGNFAAPKGVAADRRRHVYVADALLDAVQAFGDDGQLLLGFGEQGMKAGQFWMPNGLFINDADVLYVADAYNQRVQRFQLLPPPAVAGEAP
jgi:sugar lactone lactonase YvrE